MNATQNSQSIHPVTAQSLKVLGLALICVLAFLFHIWFRTLVVTQGFEVGRLQKQLITAESQLALATVERNQMLSSHELDRWAQLFRAQGQDLDAPKAHQIIYLPKSLLELPSGREK